MTLQTKQCLEKVEAAFILAEAHYGRKFQRCPVEFSSRLTSGGGYAKSKRVDGSPIKITLSTQLLYLNGEEFINQVPGHETAHIIANQLVMGDAGHGRMWQHVMTVIGQTPERTHGLKVDTSNRVQAKCSCEVHSISKKRASNMRNGANYTCKSCKTRIQLI